MTQRIPGFADLSEDQDGVLDVPLGESLIVTGPPGSGKTIMAMYRAKMLHDLGEPTQLLTYGSLLSSYVREMIAELGIDGLVSTYHQWFHGFFRRNYGRNAPKVDRWNYDWQACKQILLTEPLPQRDRRHFIIDEGQDMPQDFYLVLSLASNSMTVFADENQRITATQSTISEISAASQIHLIRQLGVNHRNTREIADLAATYHTGKLSTEYPNTSKLRSDFRPSLHHMNGRNDAIEFISSYERANSSCRVGVLLPHTRLIKSFYNRLSGKTRRPAQVYLSSESRGKMEVPSVSRPGVTLVSWASAKGLDFDAVFLPELESVSVDPRSESYLMQMYVLVTRARSRLFLLYSGEGEPDIVRSLPLDLIDDMRELSAS